MKFVASIKASSILTSQGWIVKLPRGFPRILHHHGGCLRISQGYGGLSRRRCSWGEHRKCHGMFRGLLTGFGCRHIIPTLCAIPVSDPCQRSLTLWIFSFYSYFRKSVLSQCCSWLLSWSECTNTMKQWWINGSGCGWGYRWHFTPNVSVTRIFIRCSLWESFNCFSFNTSWSLSLP